MASTNQPLRFALLGCGRIGRLHAERLAADGRAHIVVCCDPVREAAQQLKSSLANDAAVETDWRVALDQHVLDGCIVCSPTLDHHAQASHALDHRLHVLCEKPLAGKRTEIVDLIERYHRMQRILSVSHQRRYLAPYATARRELTERKERYGELREIHLFVCERWQQTIAGTWRDDPAVGAGYFGDAGIHQIDIINFLTGFHAQRVFAISHRRESRVQIVTAVLAELTGGVNLVAHFVGDANHWREDIHFHCAKADLLLRSEELFRAEDNRVEKITDLVPGTTPDAAFVEAVLSGRPTISPAETALPIYDWTRAVLTSVRDECWVAVGDPESGGS